MQRGVHPAPQSIVPFSGTRVPLYGDGILWVMVVSRGPTVQEDQGVVEGPSSGDGRTQGHGEQRGDVRSSVAGSGRQRQPLARGIALLTAMVESEQDVHGVRELGTELGVSASTAHRLLSDLERLGMVSHLPDGTYRLGPEFLRLAWTTEARYPFYKAAEDILRDLTGASGETSFFGVYNERHHEMMFALTADSSHPLRYTLPLQTWLPLHAGASGLAILAFLPEATRAEVLERTLDPITDRTVVDPDRITERLAVIRRDGYALTRGERIPGAVAIAAPVFGLSESISGSVGITVPESRLDADSTDELIRLVTSAAIVLTQRISGDARSVV